MNTIRPVIFLLLLCVPMTLISGCAGSKAASGSGFLGDPSVYSQLRDHQRFEGVRVVHFKDPSVLKGSSYIVPPVRIYLNQEGRDRGISQEDLADLALFFRNEIVEVVRQRAAITNVPGPGVRTLRVAISDADPNLPLLNIHPGTVISGAGLGGATIELAIEESSTGELIIAATASKLGARYKYAAGLTKWGHTEEVLRDFAQLIGQRLEEIEAGTPTEN